MIIAAAALLTAFVLILILLQPSRVIYVRLLSVPTLCILFILCLILLSDTSVKAAMNGLKLWAGVVVPSLFPFFAAAEILNSTGFIRASGILLEPLMRPFFNVPGCGSFALLMGVCSGYPVGAKITCDFRERGYLSRAEAERLISFTNNSGPLFIVGAVGTGMYGSHRLGILLLACHILACITVGFLFRFYKSDRNSCKKTGRVSNKAVVGIKPGRAKANTGNVLREFRNKLLDSDNGAQKNIGTIIGDSVKNSVGTILAIGGFIVLFSVIISILAETGIIGTAADLTAHLFLPPGFDKNLLRGILSGLFEITTGSNIVSTAVEIPITLQLPAASLVIGWAGLSVHFQVLSIASKTDISIRPYLIGKMLQGIISAFYTWIFLKGLHLKNIAGEPVLGSNTFTPGGWLANWRSSLLILSVAIGLITCLVFVSRFAAGCVFRPKRYR